MNKITFLLLLLTTSVFAQPEKVNDQSRFDSDSRLFYLWNEAKETYDLRDTEYENSLIDIREIGSRSNGYIIITLSDDGKARTYHGSIVSFNLDENGISTWVMRSKNARGKLVHDPQKKTMTYSYESNEKRYVKIFIFNIKSPNDNSD